MLGINPFDQPNVQEAKDNTQKVLQRYAARASCRRSTTRTTRPCAPCSSRPSRRTTWRSWATCSRRSASTRRSRACATAIRDATKATTTFGYGPRFLHSTGQFHKGGPKTGVFLQFVHDGEEDVEIPEAGYTFGTLKNAQATGDLETLQGARGPGRSACDWRATRPRRSSA